MSGVFLFVVIFSSGWLASVLALNISGYLFGAIHNLEHLLSSANFLESIIYGGYISCFVCFILYLIYVIKFSSGRRSLIITSIFFNIAISVSLMRLFTWGA